MARDYFDISPFKTLFHGPTDFRVASAESSVSPIVQPQDIVTGTPDDDTLFGTPAADTVSGLHGDDTLYGLGGDDLMYGGEGDDHIKGDNRNDDLYGDPGDDVLTGLKGKDHLFGGAGDDFLNGDNTKGTIHAGDQLKGGTGWDTYAFTAGNSSSTYHDETIGLDFGATDTIHLVDPVSGTFLPSSTSFTINGALDNATFDADLAAGTALAVGEATIYEPNSGSEAGKFYLVVNMDGITGYQPNTDLVVELTNSANLGSFSTAVFV